MGGLISVIIPVYKVEDYLDRCVNSVVSQTYKDLEIILVDDGSPDRCPEICDEWAKKDERIKVVHKKNGGLSDARNTGLENSNGDYISFLDSDDYIHPNAYEILLATIKEQDADIVGCELLNVDVNGKIINSKWTGYSNVHNFNEVYNGKEFLAKILEDQVVPYAWNKLYKRQVIENQRFTVGALAEDILYYMGFCDENIKFYDIPNPLFYYTSRDESISAGFNEKFFIARIEHIIKNEERLNQKFNNFLKISLTGCKLTFVEYFLAGCPYDFIKNKKESYLFVREILAKEYKQINIVPIKSMLKLKLKMYYSSPKFMKSVEIFCESLKALVKKIFHEL